MAALDNIYIHMDNVKSEYNIQGVFEVHITVECITDEDLSLFLERCEVNNVKPIIIELSKGDYARQVMTSSFIVGHYKDDILQKAKNLANVMFGDTSLKTKIKRLKIESLARNPGVPLDTNPETDKYFEFHYKIALQDKENDKSEYNLVKDLVKGYDGRLSRNAFKKVEGAKHYFITKRVHSAGQVKAFEEYNELKNVLADNGYPVLKSEAEFVVYDSNYNLDSGWTE